MASFLIQPILSITTKSLHCPDNILTNKHISFNYNFSVLEMKNIFAGLFPRVLRVRIQGNINQKLSDSIVSGLTKSTWIKPESIVVTISSAGGSLTQAKNIVDILKQYSNKNNIPIYTFAQDQCLGSANVILTSGAKCYANQMSMIGDIGFIWSSLWFKKFSQKYNIKTEYVTAGQNKIKFNPFEQLKPESQKWMKNYLYLLEHDLKVNVIDNRSTHFQRLKLQKASIEQNLFSKGVISSEDALKYGMIDGLANLDEILQDRFSGVKIHEVNKSNKFRKLRENIGKLGFKIQTQA